MNTTKMVYRTFMITGAVVLTCSPAAIAISGSSSSARGNAAASQYDTPPEDKGPVAAPTTGATAEPTVEVQPTVTSNPEQPQQPETPNGPTGTPNQPGPDNVTPTTREQGTTTPASSSSSLPFTGGPVLPLVLGAVALLGTGALLRRASGPRSTD